MSEERQTEVITSATIEQMRGHRSIRAYRTDPVPDDWVEAVVSAAQWASSSTFRQAYSVIAIRDAVVKSELSEYCGGQKWVETCPVFLVFCADMNRLDDACRAHDARANLEYTETFLLAAVDTALLMQNAALAAESLGLGMVMIGGIRNHPREVIRLLHLPPGVFGIAGMCLGFPDAHPVQRPRLPLREVLHWERYDASHRADNLQEYDIQVREAQIYKKKDGSVDGWTDVAARNTSRPPAEDGRRELRAILQEQSFEMK